jgi:hypothetical protein
MSALGQKQTGALQLAMSALPPKADMCSAQAHVRFTPNSDRKSGHCGQALPNAFFAYAARSTRVVISLRSAPKSMGLVKSASAPPSNALRLVSTSP